MYFYRPLVYTISLDTTQIHPLSNSIRAYSHDLNIDTRDILDILLNGKKQRVLELCQCDATLLYAVLFLDKRCWLIFGSLTLP